MKATQDTIHIAVISDEGYAYPTTVMLASAKYNKKKDSLYCVHCISNGMSLFSQNQIKALAAEDFNVVLYEIDDKDKYNAIDINLDGTWTKSAIIKTDLPVILNNRDKVLFLDGDILVTKDLSDLWNIDIRDYLLAAAPSTDQKRAKIFDVETYFNAGVMLMNLEKWREDDIVTKVWEHFHDNPLQYALIEQDVFNKVCKGNVKYLPYIWNCYPVKCRLDITLEDVNKLYRTSFASWEEMEAKAAVFHYVYYKPWRDSTLPHALLWQKYHNISPYGNTALIYPPKKEQPYTSRNIKGKLLFFIPLFSIKDREHKCSIRVLGIEFFRVKKQGKRRTLCFLYIPIVTWKI